MLRASLYFFIIGLLFFVLGASGIGYISVEIGRILLIVFLVLSVISFIAGRRGPPPA